MEKKYFESFEAVSYTHLDVYKRQIHGSSNYDSHFIVRQLGYDITNVHVIPNTREKYISFAKKTHSGLNIRFIDTYRFMRCV